MLFVSCYTVGGIDDISLVYLNSNTKLWLFTIE